MNLPLRRENVQRRLWRRYRSGDRRAARQLL